MDEFEVAPPESFDSRQALTRMLALLRQLIVEAGLQLVNQRGQQRQRVFDQGQLRGGDGHERGLTFVCAIIG